MLRSLSPQPPRFMASIIALWTTATLVVWPSGIVIFTLSAASGSMRQARASTPSSDVQNTKYGRRRGSASVHRAGKLQTN